MNKPIGAALLDHTARLLAGTGLDADEAKNVARGVRTDLPASARHAAAALRGGWVNAEDAAEHRCAAAADNPAGGLT